MTRYELLKTKLLENKQKILVLTGFLLTLVIGFGSGKAYNNKAGTKYSEHTNYTVKTTQKPNKPVELKDKEGAVEEKILPTQPKGAADKCVIKGNISANGTKIYHVLGGAFYERVKAERCFASENEAKSSGFRKSSR